MRQLERDNIVAALERSGWRISGDGGTAQLLGLSPSTLDAQVADGGAGCPPARRTEDLIPAGRPDSSAGASRRYRTRASTTTEYAIAGRAPGL